MIDVVDMEVGIRLTTIVTVDEMVAATTVGKATLPLEAAATLHSQSLRMVQPSLSQASQAFKWIAVTSRKPLLRWGM